MTARLGIKLAGSPAVVGAVHFLPVMARVWFTVLDEAPEMDDGIVWCTCGSDSHVTGFHPKGLALDFRGRNIDAISLEERRQRGQAWRNRVQARLGSEYDVLFEEHENPDRDHLHLEHDPD